MMSNSKRRKWMFYLLVRSSSWASSVPSKLLLLYTRLKIFKIVHLVASSATLLAAGVLGDRFCSLAHRMFSQFSGKKQANSRLDFTGGDSGFLIVVSETRSFASNSLKDVIHERVHDTHRFAWDTSVWMDLLHHFIDVNCVAFFSFARSFLFASRNGFLCHVLVAFLSNYSFTGHC